METMRSTKITVSWDIKPYSLVDRCQRFGRVVTSLFVEGQCMLFEVLGQWTIWAESNLSIYLSVYGSADHCGLWPLF
jgi:hypothetical protein